MINSKIIEMNKKINAQMKYDKLIEFLDLFELKYDVYENEEDYNRTKTVAVHIDDITENDDEKTFVYFDFQRNNRFFNFDCEEHEKLDENELTDYSVYTIFG